MRSRLIITFILFCTVMLLGCRSAQPRTVLRELDELGRRASAGVADEALVAEYEAWAARRGAETHRYRVNRLADGRTTVDRQGGGREAAGAAGNLPKCENFRTEVPNSDGTTTVVDCVVTHKSPDGGCTMFCVIVVVGGLGGPGEYTPQ